MVEFALGSGILVTVFVSTFQYGYIFYQYNAIFNAVNDGAHYAALLTYDSNGSAPSSTYTTNVKNMVVYGDPTGQTTTHVVRGLAPSNMTITVGYTFSRLGMGVCWPDGIWGARRRLPWRTSILPGWTCWAVPKPSPAGLTALAISN